MSYVSLYRKWRSQNFDEIVGQTAIVQTLKNAIANNRLAHAYLFSGPRGTGKTSTARILAKALNCEKGPTPAPCQTCANCIKITGGQSVNVIEIDAASNRGIDEIRELREKIRYAPVEGRYKVYIIDEVHMLTPEAFNALLKTLEEPPSHTIFVLATTELHKVPLTIASRCQRLDFARLKLNDISSHLQKIASAEGFEVEEKALNLIARMSEGAMRDAISLLDQLVSFSGGKITYDAVVLLMGTADEELLFAFADAVLARDTARVLELIGRGMDEGRSTPQVARDMVAHFRDLLHLKVGAGEALELTRDYFERLKAQAEKFSLEAIKSSIRALSRAEMDMKWHPHSRLVLEVALIELLGEERPTAAVERIETVEVKRKTAETQITSNDESPAAAADTRLAKIKACWQDVLESVKKKSVSGYVSLHEGAPVEFGDDGRLVIAFRRGYAFHKERLEEARNRAPVEEALREVAGEKILIECVVDEEKKEPALSPGVVAEYFEGRVL